MCHLDNMFQFAWLFFDFSSQEQTTRCQSVSMEFVERVKHVESVHVNDGCVYCQLAHRETLPHVLD